MKDWYHRELKTGDLVIKDRFFYVYIKINYWCSIGRDNYRLISVSNGNMRRAVKITKESLPEEHLVNYNNVMKRIKAMTLTDIEEI